MINHSFKATAAAAALAVAATVSPAGGTAYAGQVTETRTTTERHVYEESYTRTYEAPRRERRDRGDAIAAGILGLAAGAIIVGALSQPRYQTYSAPAYAAPPPPPPVPSHGYRPHVRKYGGYTEYRQYGESYGQNYGQYGGSYDAAPAPWSADWYAYCASKYRSFDPQTGTYQPYQGGRRLCR
jgi:hypothetical protein